MNESIIERLAGEALENNYFDALFVKSATLYSDYLFDSRDQKTQLTQKEFFHLLRFSDILSNSMNSIARNKAFQTISLLSHYYKDDPVYKVFAKAVFAKLGNFPAIQYLQLEDESTVKLPFERKIEKEIKEIVQAVPGSDSLIFTDTQYKLFTELSDAKSFSFSGPTSMGKSFIIKSFIRKAISNIHPENIVIVVPTRALINQFAIDLKKELGEVLQKYNFKILTNSNVTEFSDTISTSYIFVLTPERLISYLSQKSKPALGYIFVDEAHKIAAQGDIRSVTSYTAIEKALKHYPTANLYFAAPNISNPEVFLNLFKREANNSFYTVESPVSQNLFFIDLLNSSATHYVDGKTYTSRPRLLAGFKDANSLMRQLGKHSINIVYCNSHQKTIQKSLEFYQQPKNSGYQIDDEIKKAIRQIRSFIHKDYYLATFLEAGIAFHYGYLPQVIRNVIEDLYRKELIQYLFCTSTLLEGVNLPAKNIFILTNKKGQPTFEPIDFWNLAGRAGRLKHELSGNIFCVRENKEDWKKTDILLERREAIKIEPTILSRTDKNLKKIEAILLNEDIKGTEKEKEILKYIANIICIDTMELDANYKSPVIRQLIDNNEDQVIKYARLKTENLNIPKDILRFNQSINLRIQNKVYDILLKKKDNHQDLKLPNQINYDHCLLILELFYGLYEWDKEEKNLKSKDSLKYYALLVSKWINGTSLSQIINEAIAWKDSNNSDFYIDHKNVGKFDKTNKRHINELINNIIEDIERKLRFTFEKYFAHYYTILTQLLGEENAGPNWAQFLEYGTQNRIVIALQNLGLSRHTATYIYQHHRSSLEIENNKLKNIDKERLLLGLNKESMEYEEISAVL